MASSVFNRIFDWFSSLDFEAGQAQDPLPSFPSPSEQIPFPHFEESSKKLDKKFTQIFSDKIASISRNILSIELNEKEQIEVEAILNHTICSFHILKGDDSPYYQLPYPLRIFYSYKNQSFPAEIESCMDVGILNRKKINQQLIAHLIFNEKYKTVNPLSILIKNSTPEFLEKSELNVDIPLDKASTILAEFMTNFEEQKLLNLALGLNHSNKFEARIITINESISIAKSTTECKVYFHQNTTSFDLFSMMLLETFYLPDFMVGSDKMLDSKRHNAIFEVNLSKDNDVFVNENSEYLLPCFNRFRWLNYRLENDVPVIELEIIPKEAIFTKLYLSPNFPDWFKRRARSQMFSKKNSISLRDDFSAYVESYKKYADVLTLFNFSVRDLEYATASKDVPAVKRLIDELSKLLPKVKMLSINTDPFIERFSLIKEMNDPK